MWDGLREICLRERSTMNRVCTTVSLQKLEQTSLTAAIRVYVMRYFRDAATEEGHVKAGHGNGINFGSSLQAQPFPASVVSRLTKTSFS
jgi:predicted DNA-binding ribbon-helix-helix protein